MYIFVILQISNEIIGLLDMSIFQYFKEHNISETGAVSIHRCWSGEYLFC
jgi:hypothetical protein